MSNTEQTTIFNKIKNKYGTDNLGIQKVFTPINKIEEVTGIKFFDFVTPETKNIGVLFNWEFIYHMLEEALKNNYTNDMKFTYFYDSEADKEAIEVLNSNWFYKNRFAKVNYELKLVNICEFTEKTKDIKVIKKAMAGKHFDIVFSNPPYASKKNVGLDIKILMSVLEVANESIFIQPSAWALRTVYKMKIQKDLIRLYGKNVKRLIFVSPEIFGSGCKKFEPILISHIDKSKTFDKILVNDSIKNVSYEVNSINDVNLFSLEGKWDIVQSIINKLNSYMEKHGRCSDFIIPHDKINEYSVWISLIRGNASNRYTKNGSYNHAFCSVINQDDSNKINPSTVLKPRDLWVWAFNSNIEQDNFINYCKTKIARFSQAIYKFDGNVNMGDVPWFDFQNEISDEYAVKKLKLSEDEWNYIDTFIEK